MISGTPEYLAPEVIGGASPSPAADLYAVGVILYELIVGTTPFAGGNSFEILTRQLEEDVVPPSLRCPEQRVPRDLERVVLRALEKDPRSRFPSAAAFATGLIAATPAIESARVRAHSVTQPLQIEGRTHDWSCTGLVTVRDRLATDGVRSTHPPSVLRDAVVCAIRAGDVDAIVGSYLELSRALIDDHQLRAAATELEEAVTLLSCGSGATRVRAPIWRLLLSLAAVYDGLGDPIRARSAAFASRNDALQANDVVGEVRAAALIDRMIHGPASTTR